MPLYETDVDRSREQEVADRLSKVVGGKIVKLSGQYARLDRMIVWPDKRHAFVEIKCRNVGHDAYPTLMLSAAKWREGVEMAWTTGGKFLVVAGYRDGDWAYLYDQRDIDTRAIWCEYGGRTVQTRGSTDIEPVIHIPSTLMIPVL